MRLCVFFFLYRTQVTRDVNKLHFKDVRLEEAGIYQCVAENTHGMIVSSTYVNVLGEYSFIFFSPLNR